MSIEVLTFRILIKPVDVIQEKYKTSIPNFIVAGDQKDREQKGVDIGTVVSVGPTAFNDYKVECPVAPGDQIVFAKFAGKPVVDPDCPEAQFVVINDEDAIAIIRKNGE